MRRLALVVLGACGFSGKPVVGGITDTIDAKLVDGSTVTVVDAPAVCPWTYTPSNIVNLATLCGMGVTQLAPLPTGVELAVSFTGMGTVATQSDGTQLRIVRVSQLVVDGTLDLQGTEPILLAVDGQVSITGTINVTAGANDSIRCAMLDGGDGHAPGGAMSDGSGGGGGAAGGGDGGDGGDGGGGPMKGGKGPKAVKKISTLVPMRAGCPGGKGGSIIGFAGGTAGDGGGGLQISSAMPITVSGKIAAVGKGGGEPGAHFGGGGGGSGGAIFLEASAVHVSGTLCSDGGSGAVGGGNTAFGSSGNDGKCTGHSTMPNPPLVNPEGGNGGNGGARDSQSNASNATNATGQGGGGGGGGGAGWIHVHDLGGAIDNTGSNITPDAMFD